MLLNDENTGENYFNRLKVLLNSIKLIVNNPLKYIKNFVKSGGQLAYQQALIHMLIPLTTKTVSSLTPLRVICITVFCCKKSKST